MFDKIKVVVHGEPTVESLIRMHANLPAEAIDIFLELVSATVKPHLHYEFYIKDLYFYTMLVTEGYILNIDWDSADQIDLYWTPQIESEEE